MEKIADPTLSELAIYAMSLVLMVTVVTSGIAAYCAIQKDPTAASECLKEFFSGGNSLKILTVFAVLVTATYLALSGNLSEGAIALLSSVSGYVLGTMQNKP